MISIYEGDGFGKTGIMYVKSYLLNVCMIPPHDNVVVIQLIDILAVDGTP